MTAHVDPKNATLNIRIEPTLLKGLRATAKKQGMPHAALVRILIRTEIDRQARVDNNNRIRADIKKRTGWK